MFKTIKESCQLTNSPPAIFVMQNDMEPSKAVPLNAAKQDGPAPKPHSVSLSDTETRKLVEECKRLQGEMMKLSEENRLLRVSARLAPLCSGLGAPLALGLGAGGWRGLAASSLAGAASVPGPGIVGCSSSAVPARGPRCPGWATRVCLVRIKMCCESHSARKIPVLYCYVEIILNSIRFSKRYIIKANFIKFSTFLMGLENFKFRAWLPLKAPVRWLDLC